MASGVSTFSGFVAKSHQTLPYVSSSPSKIPYVGFSPVRLQTGIPLEPSPNHQSLSTGPAYPLTTPSYIQSQSNSFSSVALPGTFSENQVLDDPVQRPLAPRPAMLSGQISAYYGLIRNSRSVPSIYGLDDGSWPYGLVWAGTERLPNLLRRSFFPRAASCTPVDQEGDCGCCSPSRSSLRHIRTGSASTIPRTPVLAGSCNEATKFACATAR